MLHVITTEKKPIKCWVEEVTGKTLEQAQHLANLPFTFKHIALMADAHQGYGMPIGGVLATNGVIIPNAVGEDAGCGMCVIKTNLFSIDKGMLIKIINGIRHVIPVGKGKWHDSPQPEQYMPTVDKKYKDRYIVIRQQYYRALHQLGTLGGGNHFIEIQKGSDGFIWIMIHCGSRNLGKKVNDHYNKIAQTLNSTWFSEVPKKWALAFLPIDTQEAKNYRAEMEYCVEFALANRELIMERIKTVFYMLFPDIEFGKMLNVPHNYAAMEHHYSKNVMVHRKGATRARNGQICIIPGSQGHHSYIAHGLGEPLSFYSCSHGAGRKMGRKDAQRSLNLINESKRLNDQGIVHSLKTVDDLEEAPGAYKDIESVMSNQRDLVKPIIKLQPLAVVKG